ncbi:MAG: VCBS repeat-containing protein [Leptolyngbyaceae cyanobacterium SM2_5_2]|nr:VCBS repeat-containing protein [Leptolyngbyaceae cyanobacterium SM2_5_2]
MLWRNSLTGQTRVTAVSDAHGLSHRQLASATALQTQVSDLNWQIASTADFDGDGEGDLLWRHQISGETVLWFVKDGALASGGLLSDSAPPIWQLQGAGDLDGDDRPELLWRHSVTGDLVYWQLEGTNLVGGGADGSPA